MRSIFAAVSVLALAAVLAACATPPDEPMPLGPVSGPIDTGTYPNLNVAPQTAAAPITDEDKESLKGRLAGAQSRQQSAGRGAGTKGNSARLKKLADDQGAETLKAIQAQ